MKKIFITGLLALLTVSCSSANKDDSSLDLFSELRKLNTIDEKSLSSSDKEKHTAHKIDLNNKLDEYLKQPTNVSDFSSLETKKQELADNIKDLNTKDEATLDDPSLTQLREERSKSIDQLESVFKKAALFQEIKNLNKVEESKLSADEKIKHTTYKNDLNTQLTQMLSTPEEKSDNPLVEKRKQEILDELSGLNQEDESNMQESELSGLREKRESLLNELLGLLDGSIVPQEPEKPIENLPIEPKPEPVVTPPAPIVPPTPEPVVEPVKKPRGELFEELKKLNTVDEATLSPQDKTDHQALKQDLNTELQEVLAKEENHFFDPQQEKEKIDLQDELINLNNTDESTLAPAPLQELRDRRSQIIEKLEDLLKNAQRHPAVDYGITSEKKEGIAVKQEADGAFDVLFEDLLFTFNKTDLKPKVKKTLKKIAKLLQEHPDAIADIGGHSDNIGPKWAKVKIASGRAANAKKYLVKAGIDPTRLTAKGYADKKPLAKPFTSANRRKNRRVEVHVQMNKKEEAVVEKPAQDNIADETQLNPMPNVVRADKKADTKLLDNTIAKDEIQNPDNSEMASQENSPSNGN